MIVSRQKMGSESRGIADIKPRMIGEIDNEKGEGRIKGSFFKKAIYAARTLSNSNTRPGEKIKWENDNDPMRAFSGSVRPSSLCSAGPLPSLHSS